MKRLGLFLISLGWVTANFVGCEGREANRPQTPETHGAARVTVDSQLIVLAYHHLTEDNSQSNGSSLMVTDFAKQMAYLHENNYKTLGIEDFVSCYSQSFPPKSVMITFDDGYRSFFELAYPILKQYDFKAVLFPVVSTTAGLERRIVWNKHLTFHEIRLMDKESGLVDVGSHTYDLHYYREDGRPAVEPEDGEDEKEYIARIRKDLRVSKDLLELQTDQKITALAWPYGLTNETAIRIAQDLDYKLLFTIRRGPVTKTTPLESIPRYIVNSGSLEKFKEIFNGAKDKRG